MLFLVTDAWCISCEIAIRWMLLDLDDDKSTLVQVMAWCRQATSHYLNQCWHRSLSPYGVTRPQWVINRHTFTYCGYICVNVYDTGYLSRRNICPYAVIRGFIIHCPWFSMLTSRHRRPFHMTGPVCGNPPVPGTDSLHKGSGMQNFDGSFVVSPLSSRTNIRVSSDMSRLNATMTAVIAPMEVKYKYQ